MDILYAITCKIHQKWTFYMPLHIKVTSVDLFDVFASKVDFSCLRIRKVSCTLKYALSSKSSDFHLLHVLKCVVSSKKSDFERMHTSAPQEPDFAHNLRFTWWICTKSSPLKAFLLGDEFPCIKDEFNMLKIVFGSSILGHVF